MARFDSELFTIYLEIYLDRSEDLECLDIFEKCTTNMGTVIAGIGTAAGGGVVTIGGIAGRLLAEGAGSGCLITAICVW